MGARGSFLTPKEKAAIGYYGDNRYILKFGENTAVTAPEDIWLGGDTYTGQPTSGSAETVEVFSASAADTAAGTGMRTIRLVGLDGDYAWQEEDIALDGTNAVESVGTWWRLFRAYGLTGGSGMTNAGQITVRHSTTTSNVFAQLSAGFGQTQIGAFTIPAGYTGLMTRLKASIAASNATAATAQVAFRIRTFGSSIWRDTIPILISSNGSALEDPEGGIVIPEKADVVLRATFTSAANLRIIGRYEIALDPTSGPVL